MPVLQTWNWRSGSAGKELNGFKSTWHHHVLWASVWTSNWKPLLCTADLILLSCAIEVDPGLLLLLLDQKLYSCAARLASCFAIASLQLAYKSSLKSMSWKCGLCTLRNLYCTCCASFLEAFSAIIEKCVFFNEAKAWINCLKTKALWKRATLILLWGQFTSNSFRQVWGVEFILGWK